MSALGSLLAWETSTTQTSNTPVKVNLNWGAVMLNPKNELPEKVKQWIETAREFVPSKAEDEDEIETSEEA